MTKKLSRSMTVTQFDNGYWYASELKEFATSIGIPSAHALRKDELEEAIKLYLTSGTIKSARSKRTPADAIKDVERGLRLNLPVVNYTNDKETKDFLERESRKLAPGVRRKSGARYRLNRWREAQIAKNVRITYRDLVHEYIRLNETKNPFARIPHGRYINFLSDFLANEKDATREQAIAAWKKLKALDVPKDYRSWVKSRRS